MELAPLKLNVRKGGNSLVATIPSFLVKQFGIKPGNVLEVKVKCLTQIKPKQNNEIQDINPKE